MPEFPRYPPSPTYGDEPREAPPAAQEGYRVVAPGFGYLRRGQGQPLGLPTTAPRPPAILDAMDNLNLALAAPFEALNTLEARLTAILRPIAAAPAGTGPGQANPCPAQPPLAERLQDFAAQLVHLTARIELLADRVEL